MRSSRVSGTLPVVAEDLGMITPEVYALRDHYHLPGMKILQFAFDGTPDNPYLPHNHAALSAVYTGTHDNDTTLGWYHSLEPQARAHIDEYLGHPGEDAMVADPLGHGFDRRSGDRAVQDVLALDGSLG